MNTIFLHPDTWDITLDTSGNIAVATEPYQQAQDISSSCRVFKVQKADGTISGDDYYKQQDGIPILEIMGRSSYPLALYQRNLHDRAMLVNGIVSIDVKLQQLKDRVLSGAIIFTNEDNIQGTVGL